ncbi:MAG: sugar ABC transporter substrate-binding protein [Magnetococcus sp. WYHC-3]
MVGFPGVMGWILALLLWPLGGMAAEAPGEGGFTIGVLYWSMNIPGQVAMRAGVEAEAERINQEAATAGLPRLTLLPQVAGDGPQGVENQIQQMVDMVARKPHAIIIQPTDNAALSTPLQAANGAGIPVIAYDQYISGGILSAYVTSDNYQAGVVDGEYVAAHFMDSQEIRLILVEYPRVSSTVERVDGFLDALGRNGQKYRILKSYQAVEPVAGAAAGAQILKDFPEKGSVDVVFTVNDGGGLNVVEALARAGRDEIFVASIDGDPASVENIRQGRLTRIDAAQFCGPLGADAMKAAYAILLGRSVPRHALVPTFPVTRETLERYPGWAGPLPEAFTKPWNSLEPAWDNALRVVIP